MNWTDEQRAAIETLVARDGCCTVSTDDVSGLTERIGWNSPSSMATSTVNVRCLRLQEHLRALLGESPFDGYYEMCHWCDADRTDQQHADDCAWALARAHLDSLEGGS